MEKWKLTRIAVDFCLKRGLICGDFRTNAAFGMEKITIIYALYFYYGQMDLHEGVAFATSQ